MTLLSTGGLSFLLQSKVLHHCDQRASSHSSDTLSPLSPLRRSTVEEARHEKQQIGSGRRGDALGVPVWHGIRCQECQLFQRTQLQQRGTLK
jgi:hypothetical protein